MMTRIGDWASFSSGLVGELGERWFEAAFIRREGHSNPPVGNALVGQALVGNLPVGQKRDLYIPGRGFLWTDRLTLKESYVHIFSKIKDLLTVTKQLGLDIWGPKFTSASNDSPFNHFDVNVPMHYYDKSPTLPCRITGSNTVFKVFEEECLNVKRSWSGEFHFQQSCRQQSLMTMVLEGKLSSHSDFSPSDRYCPVNIYASRYSWPIIDEQTMSSSSMRDSCLC